MKKETIELIRNFNNQRAVNPGVLALPDARLEGEVPGFPGLIFRAVALAEAMAFLIPRWDDFSTNPASPDIVSVWMKPFDDAEWGDPFIRIEVSSPAAEYAVNIAQARRGQGRHLLRYEIFVDNVGNTSESLPQLLIVDLTPPYSSFPGPIPAPLPPAGLPIPADLDYFQSLPDEAARFTIPDPSAHGGGPGSWLHIYYNGSDHPYPPSPPNPGLGWELPADWSFPLPLAVVAANPDGLRSIRYVLHDAAGNPTPLSASYSLDVGLLPAPANLRAPLVDLAFPGDGLIDRADTAQLNGMTVRISEYSNFLRGNDGDVISVTLTTTLGTQTLADVPLGSNTFPVQISAGYPTLLLLYGATEGRLAVTISYAIKRRSVSYPSALTTTVDLDLFVVGPTPTNPPDLINTDLKPVVVTGEDAAGTEGPPNELLPEHANRPAIARVELWDTPPTPDARAFTIYLWYDGVLANTQFVAAGTANQIIQMSIPWSIISERANGTKLVYYTIGATGSNNRQFSPNTPVEVQANFKELAPPQVRFLAGSGAGIVNCDSFRPTTTPPAPDYLTIFITPSEHFTLNMVVRLHWQGYSDDAGTIAVPGTDDFIDSLPLTQAMLNNGFELRLSHYMQFFKPIQPNSDARLAGSARLHYTIQLPEGPLNSAEAMPRVRGTRAGGANGTYCDGTGVPLP